MSFITKALNRKANSRLTPMPMGARAQFAFTYAGWTITTPPPAISGAGKFAPSPTAPVRIRSGNGAWLPPQSVTPAKPNTDSVWADAAAGNDEEFWSLVASNGSPLPVTFTLNLPTPPTTTYDCDVEMTLVLAACTPGPPTFSIVANGHALKIHHPTDDDWSTQRVTIPAHFLANGINRIVLTPLAGYYGIWLQSVDFASRSVPISISSQWLQVCAGELGRGDTFDQSVQLTHGTAMTDSQIRAFAQQFGINVEGCSIENLLTGLSAHLAGRFFLDERANRSTLAERETTVAYDVKIQRTREEEHLTFQVWQLALVYEANGCQLVQALGPNGPIVFQQFPHRS